MLNVLLGWLSPLPIPYSAVGTLDVSAGIGAVCITYHDFHLVYGIAVPVGNLGCHNQQRGERVGRYATSVERARDFCIHNAECFIG